MPQTFSLLDSFNLRAKLPQRGHSKEGRDNLRLIGLALLVSADGEVPLFHHCYAGNQHDSRTFGTLVQEIAHNKQNPRRTGSDAIARRIGRASLRGCKSPRGVIQLHDALLSIN